MRKIIKGDKIYSKSKGTYHIVDDVETIEGFEIIFTEDIKGFPFDDVKKCVNSFADFLDKKLNKQDIDEGEYNSFVKSIASKLTEPIILYDVDLFLKTGIWIKQSQAY